MCMARLREIVPGVTGHGAPNGAHGIINPNTSGPLLHSSPTFNYDDIMRTSCSNQAGHPVLFAVPSPAGGWPP